MLLANRVRSGRKQPQRAPARVARPASRFLFRCRARQPLENRPATVVHADWSVDPRKRWSAVASLTPAGNYHVERIETFRGIAVKCPGQKARVTVYGFDFPIGVPEQYGLRVPASSFRAFLALLGSGDFAEFFAPARNASQISTGRPFYPAQPGGTKQVHLLEAHGAETINELLRRCERATADRRAACSIFWTLGGNQVGKAALTGWRDIIIPRLSDEQVAVWPFDGSLSDLLRTKATIIVETYPADAYRQLSLSLPRRWSKRSQSDRKVAAESLTSAAERLGISTSEEVRSLIHEGFGSDSRGEDRFDAFAGLLGMVAVVLGSRPEGAPDDDAVRTWEGWILGQSAGEALILS